MKQVIIINGKGGVGKDFLCDIVGKYYKTKVISVVDEVKKNSGKLWLERRKNSKSKKVSFRFKIGTRKL